MRERTRTIRARVHASIFGSLAWTCPFCGEREKNTQCVEPGHPLWANVNVPPESPRGTVAAAITMPCEVKCNACRRVVPAVPET